MDAPPTVACTQCGGPVPLREGERWVVCGHCRVPLALDLDRFLLHEMIRPRVTGGQVVSVLQRFLEDAEVMDPVRIASQRLEYQPWFLVPGEAGDVLVPAAPDVVTGSAARARRAAEEGTAAPFDDDAMHGADVIAPQRTLAEAVAAVAGGRAAGARLVHTPVWRVAYVCGEQRHGASIDAATGAVGALSLPAPSSKWLTSKAIAWMVVAGIVCAVVAAVLPGLWLPLAAYAVLGFVAAAVLRRGETERAARP